MQSNSTVKTITRNILLYAVWLAFFASQIWLLLWVHELLVAFALSVATNAWVPRAIDMWSMVILGIPVLAAIFITEAYLAKGVQIQQFWQRVARVALIEGAIALVLLAIDYFFL